MAQETNDRQSFLRSIARDASANTIAIAAASLVPLMAMVGGGVDASRFYMAETRLQAACDAGALAARRAMDDDSFSAEDRQVGENFFDQNYTSDMFGTKGLQREYTATSDGEVNGTASGTIPTSIMGAFGYSKFDLSVDCTADINISNTDIMFVLDVTGSMGGTRIQGLRDAVMTFYDTVDGSTSASAQVRYGVVPYSMNVNVGQAIVDANPLWMAQSHEYQSRISEGTFTPWEEQTINYSRTGDASNTRSAPQINNQTYHSTFDQCVAHYNQFQTREDFVSSSQAGWTQVSETGSETSRTVVYNGLATYDTYTGAGGTYYYSSDLCDVNFNVTRFDADSTITVTETREAVWEWVYKGDVTHDLAGLYDDNQVDVQTGWANTWEPVSWDGCIEEADTVPNSTFDPVPSGAYDLDINLVPSNDNERWKPSLNGITYDREDSSGSWTRDEVRASSPSDDFDNPYYACPTAAFRLTDISRGNMKTYVDSLNASGNTYHDIGMIWGARFISPNGMFKSANETAPNGDAISRHIVFMTDGQLQPYNYGYTTYGMEWWDRRITGNGGSTEATNYHAERFQAACRAARQENMSVWVVAFGTTLTQNLIDCATPGRAFAATNSAELDDRFKEIAQQIAALRLTK